MVQGRLAVLLIACATCFQVLASEKSPHPEPRMSFIENGVIRLGVDLNLGGAITWLSKSGGDNIVNSWDLGRQIQMSYYSGPVPFSVGEKKPSAHWKHLGWNPIQAGDDFGHGARVLEHRNDGHLLYTKCAPMQWPLDNVPADCSFECWLKIDGAVVEMRCRLNNARSDTMQYPARLQELPAIYLNAPFHKIVSYTGAQPFTNDAVSEIARPAVHPDEWTHWLATERWSAMLNEEGWGFGLWNPSCVKFTGGFAGKPGPNDPRSQATGYLTAQSTEILDHNMTHEYRCELILGSIGEIRARVRAGGIPALPVWQFDHDRQGWHYVNARDTGWPVKGGLQVMLEQDDPQLVSPTTFFKAEDASKLVIEAAFTTRHHTAEIFWTRHEGMESSLSFPITGDGQMHRHEVRLADSPAWCGGIVRLRFDPVPSGAPGERVEVKAIALEK